MGVSLKAVHFNASEMWQNITAGEVLWVCSKQTSRDRSLEGVHVPGGLAWSSAVWF